MFTNLYHARVGFAPNTLSLCCCPVQYMEWETAYRESAENVWTVVTDLQKASAKDWLTHDGFCNLLKDMKNLLLSRLVISTDVNTLEIHPYSKQYIAVQFPDGQVFQCRAMPSFEASVNETAQVLNTALYFADCINKEQAEKKLSKMKMMRAATDWVD